MGRLHHVFIDAKGVVAARSSGRTLRPTLHVAADEGEAGLQRLERLVREHRRDRFRVIVDTAEEELQLESIPRLRGSDRRALIASRMSQAFRERRLGTWVTLASPRGAPPSAGDATAGGNGDGKDGAGQQRVLLASIAADGPCAPWLEVLQRAGARVDAVRSPALLAPSLTRVLGKAASGMLVSVEPAGVRQTLLLDGEARFTRLAANPWAPDAATVVDECRRTVQYALSQQSLGMRARIAGGSFQVWVVTDGLPDPQALPEVLTSDRGESLPLLRIGADKLGAPAITTDAKSRVSWPQDAGGMAVWMQPPARGLRGAGYASRALRHAAVLASARARIVGSGFCLLVAAMVGYSVVEVSERLLGLAEDEVALRSAWGQEQVALQAEAARYPMPGGEMRAVVEAAEAIARRDTRGAPFLVPVSAALEADPAIRLQSIDWHNGAAGDDGGQAGESGGPAGGVPRPAIPAGGGLPPLGAAASAAARPAPLGNGPVPMPGAGGPGAAAGGPQRAAPPDISVSLTAVIDGVTSRTQTNLQARRFVDRLAAACSCDAQLVQLPFDPSPDTPVSETAAKPAARDAKFSVRFGWRVPQPAAPQPAPGRVAALQEVQYDRR